MAKTWKRGPPLSTWRIIPKALGLWDPFQMADIYNGLKMRGDPNQMAFLWLFDAPWVIR